METNNAAAEIIPSEQDATAWHLKPAGWSGAPCPICGCEVANLRAKHRALTAEEGWMWGGLYVKTVKGDRVTAAAVFDRAGRPVSPDASSPRCSQCGLRSLYLGMATDVETRHVFCDRCRAYEIARQQRDVENVLALRVGTTVYRAAYDTVQEGTVRRVARTDGKNTIYSERADGEYMWFVAQFGSDWEGQTDQYKWFADIARARVRLVEQLRRRIEDLRRDIQRAETLISETEAAR